MMFKRNLNWTFKQYIFTSFFYITTTENRYKSELRHQMSTSERFLKVEKVRPESDFVSFPLPATSL